MSGGAQHSGMLTVSAVMLLHRLPFTQRAGGLLGPFLPQSKNLPHKKQIHLTLFSPLRGEAKAITLAI